MILNGLLVPSVSADRIFFLSLSKKKKLHHVHCSAVEKHFGCFLFITCIPDGHPEIK